jgi:hypothetical protein
VTLDNEMTAVMTLNDDMSADVALDAGVVLASDVALGLMCISRSFKW